MAFNPEIDSDKSIAIKRETIYTKCVIHRNDRVLPDTTITLTNGHKYIVKESEKEVLHLIHLFYQSANLLGGQLGGENNEE